MKALRSIGLAALALLASFLGALVPPQQSHASPSGGRPSFDCAKAASLFEHAICADSGLAAADALMAKLYAAAKTSAFGSGPSKQVAAQRAWLAARDEQCGTAGTTQERAACRRAIYDDRNKVLAVAALFRKPALALDTLHRIDPAAAAIAEAAWLYSGEPVGSDWSAPALADKRERIERLLRPHFQYLATDDRASFGRAILADDGIASLSDVMASEANFATFLNVDSAYLDGSPVMPCEALVRHPGLIAAIEPMFGSTFDSIALGSDCDAMLPPTPRLDRLAEAIRTRWSPCDGSIRFAVYRGFAADVDEARLGSEISDAKVLQEAEIPRLPGISPTLVTAAIDELAVHYLRYGRASKSSAQALARGRVRVLMGYEDAGC